MPRIPPIDVKTMPSGRGAVAVLGVAASGPALTKTQKRFNQLIDKLKGQREEVKRWEAYRRFYQQQLSDKYQPMVTRLREQRVVMAQLLDQALDGGELGKRERDKAQYLLQQLLEALLEAGEEPLLVRLHDKYAAASLQELRRERMDALRAAAHEALDIDVDAYGGGESPAEFESWLEDQVRASREQSAAAAEGDAAPKRKSAKASKREALREQVVEGGTRAVREAYRKLVSELHPDRESDPTEQIRKTELMQQVNQAYKSGDLLGLLELQLRLEQIDASALAGLADERLRHYVHVLEEQSRQLRDELSELIEPFALVLGESSARRVTPDAVQRLLDQDIRDMKAVLRKLEMDVICFRDVRQLKQSLGQYSVEPLDDDELQMPDDWQMSDDLEPARRGAAPRGGSRRAPKHRTLRRGG